MLLATDGLFDNLFDDEIADVLAQADGDGAAAAAPPPSAATLAELIVRRAREASLDQTRRTPFADGAARHGYTHSGGKLDDVTVLCVRVLPPAGAGEARDQPSSAASATPRSRL